MACLGPLGPALLLSYSSLTSRRVSFLKGRSAALLKSLWQLPTTQGMRPAPRTAGSAHRGLSPAASVHPLSPIFLHAAEPRNFSGLRTCHEGKNQVCLYTQHQPGPQDGSLLQPDIRFFSPSLAEMMKKQGPQTTLNTSLYPWFFFFFFWQLGRMMTV